MSSISNNSSLMSFSPNDLFMAFPRLMARAGSFAFITVPERLDSMIGFRAGGSVIAEATGNGSMKMISTTLSSGSSLGAALQSTVGAVATEAPSQGPSSFSFHQVRNLGGIFAYMTSKWALACFTLVSLHHMRTTALQDGIPTEQATGHHPQPDTNLRFSTPPHKFVMANTTCYTYNAYCHVPLPYPQLPTSDALPDITEVLVLAVR